MPKITEAMWEVRSRRLNGVIKGAMAEREISHEELACALEMHTNTLYKRFANPLAEGAGFSVRELVLMSEKFGISAGRLIGEKPEETIVKQLCELLRKEK